MPISGDKTCLIVPNYGSAFEGMLLTCLESVAQAAPGMRVHVAWQDMAAERVEALKKAYPDSRWTQCDFAISSDYVVRISAKTLLAEVAAKATIEDGFDRLVLMDSDILMRGPIDEAFADDFDVGFTDKPERWPLNSGVIFLRRDKACEFLRQWSGESRHICASKELLVEASSKERPYGGIDQMALFLMTAYERGRTGIVEREGIRYKALPCALFNETRSLPLPCPARFIHYKGGWHKILTRGTFYSPKRPMGDSLAMHQFYLKTALDGLCRVNDAAGRNWSLADWNLALPGYLDAETFEPRPLRILLARALAPFRKLAAGAKHLLRQLSICR
jgi:hypothetical protein